MSVTMSLDEAREIISEHNAGRDPGYVNWATACAVVSENHLRTRPKGKLLHYDVGPGFSVQSTSTPPAGAGYSQRTVDPFTRGAPEGSTFYRSGSQGAQKGEGPVGGELLMEIDAPVSAILVIAHGNGRTGIYRVGTATNAMNAGRTLTKSDTFIADSKARVAREQAAGAAMAKRISEFWAKQVTRS
jgi:hypothetical protein